MVPTPLSCLHITIGVKAMAVIKKQKNSTDQRVIGKGIARLSAFVCFLWEVSNAQRRRWEEGKGGCGMARYFLVVSRSVWGIGVRGWG